MKVYDTGGIERVIVESGNIPTISDLSNKLSGLQTYSLAAPTYKQFKYNMAEKEFSYEYNPVKEIKGGVEASKVVWSTKSLNAAVDALTKGLPLKANPFCGTNTKLLKPDLVYKRTEEEVEDYIKCMQDPLYFAEKCFLMTPKGLQPVKMRDYQKEYLTNLTCMSSSRKNATY